MWINNVSRSQADKAIAQKFMPMYEASQGQCSYASIQGDLFDETEESIIKYAKYNTANLPNMTAKIPVVPGGIKAIKQLAPEQVPINTTEIMNPSGSGHRRNLRRHLSKYEADQGIDIPSDYVWQAGLAVAKKAYATVKERDSKIHFIDGGTSSGGITKRLYR